MAAKKKTDEVPQVVVTAGGATVTVDPAATYRLHLARSVKYLGHVMRPGDRNIRVIGSVLMEIAKTAGEGTFIDVEKV